MACMIGQDVERYVATSGKMLKGNSKDELNKVIGKGYNEIAPLNNKSYACHDLSNLHRRSIHRSLKQMVRGHH